jgi:hypothetical protein
MTKMLPSIKFIAEPLQLPEKILSRPSSHIHTDACNTEKKKHFLFSLKLIIATDESEV